MRSRENQEICSIPNHKVLGLLEADSEDASGREGEREEERIGCVCVCVHGWVDGWMDGWVDGWVDG